jgi:hypothetical protein
MKYNKAVSLTFAQNVSSASVNINVPITVKKIHCKALGYTGEAPAVGVAEYGFVVSDLTQNTPIAMFYDDPTYPLSMGQDIEYVLSNPQPINGVYTFSLRELDGTPYLPFGADGGKIGMILEFNDSNEL